MTWFIYLPTVCLVFAPVAALPWGPAHILWIILLVGLLFVATLLMSDIASDYAPGLALLLGCILLGNSEILFGGGNPAGLVVSLCVIAAWCFIERRFVLIGILCLAIAVEIKPHDSGLVWLYFLIAGGEYRKRALQTLAFSAAFSLAAGLWISRVSPNWAQEWASNLAGLSSRGEVNDPGPASAKTNLIDLQTIVSIFRDDPRIYNLVSCLVCGFVLVVLSVATLRTPVSRRKLWIGLATIAPLTMLVTYHRFYDAKLLLLTIPACAMLWAQHGAIGRIAFVLNTLGLLLTSHIPSATLDIIASNFHPDSVSIPIIFTIFLTRPAPLVLLAMSILYLWVYVSYSEKEKLDHRDHPEEKGLGPVTV
jgi:hypothetical protein